MTGTGYIRVSKKRLCRICGKPDWCSRTVAGTISFCARSSLNANRISRHGWGVYYHREFAADLGLTRRFNQPYKTREIHRSSVRALPEIRDRIYRKLFELSPASTNSELVNGRSGLSERRIDDISQYGSFPRTVNERRVLVDQLTRTQAKGEDISFEGVPGFWKDTLGEWRLGSKFDSNDELLLIPFIGRDGLIQACQIRLMKHVEGSSGHYVWLSSAKERLGSSPGSPLHHVRPCNGLDFPVVVTEGALKAATAQRFLTDRYVVGNSGVATAHRAIVETARGRRLEIAFDNDSFTNPHVARALAALLRLRYSDQAAHGYDEDVRIVTWDRSVKGIDDALLSGLRLEYLTAAEWLKCLTPECFKTATQQLAPMGSKKTGGRQVVGWSSRNFSIKFP